MRLQFYYKIKDICLRPPLNNSECSCMLLNSVARICSWAEVLIFCSCWISRAFKFVLVLMGIGNPEAKNAAAGWPGLGPALVVGGISYCAIPICIAGVMGGWWCTNAGRADRMAYWMVFGTWMACAKRCMEWDGIVCTSGMHWRSAAPVSNIHANATINTTQSGSVSCLPAMKTMT